MNRSVDIAFDIDMETGEVRLRHSDSPLFALDRPVDPKITYTDLWKTVREKLISLLA